MTTPTDNNERRSSSDRRQFTYSANIPEKRSDMENRCKEERRKSKDRRKLVDRRTAVYRSWYNEIVNRLCYPCITYITFITHPYLFSQIM